MLQTYSKWMKWVKINLNVPKIFLFLHHSPADKSPRMIVKRANPLTYVQIVWNELNETVQ